MPATRLNLPLKYLTASSEPITASHSLSVERKTYFEFGIISLTPSWVVPSHITVSACSSSATGATPRLTPVEIRPWMASTFSCRISRRNRSIVSFGLVSSSITSSNLRPAMPPSLFIRSVAHCTARMPHSPAVPAAPDRGAMMPIRSGLSCASAGANIRGRGGGQKAGARKPGKIATRELHRYLPFGCCASAVRCLPYHKYITDIASSAFFGRARDARKALCRPDRLVIY